MNKTKVLKIKIGTCYVDGKNIDVFNEAWEKTSKDGKITYYEMKQPIFVREIEIKDKPDQQAVSA